MEEEPRLTPTDWILAFLTLAFVLFIILPAGFLIAMYLYAAIGDEWQNVFPPRAVATQSVPFSQWVEKQQEAKGFCEERGRNMVKFGYDGFVAHWTCGPVSDGEATTTTLHL